MPVVSETIPEALQPRAHACVAWFNTTKDAAGDSFTATGILDPEASLAAPDELRLILCGGDRCEQHSFRIESDGNTWRVSFAEPAAAANTAPRPQAELDPPPGPRLKWLDNVLGQHEFVLLLFYRGFW